MRRRKHSKAAIGFGIALIVVCFLEQALAALPTLDEHLTAVGDAAAMNYVGKQPYKVVDAAEFSLMKNYIEGRYAGVHGVHVYAYDADLVVDCVDKYTQLAATRHGLNADNWKSAPANPPRFSGALPAPETYQKDPGVFLDRTTMDPYGNPRGCLPGSVPVNRITLDMIAIFPTLKDYLNRRPLPQVYGHEYAKGKLSSSNVSNAGGEAYINLWNPYVELNSEASIMQLWVVGGSGSSLETIEAGWIKNPDGYTWGKSYPHLFLFASKGNYSSYQWDNGSWFVQTNNSVNLGGKLTLSSTAGGSQYSSKFFIFKDGASPTGNWWLFYDGVWVGYYPYTEFSSSGLRNNATIFDFGGEIDDDSSSRHTRTDMGSGYQPSSGFGYSAYIRAIRWVNLSNYYVTPTSLVTSITDWQCYNATPHFNGGVGWEAYIYLGGEGYTANCP